eukprot:gnl/MRDRNA2_/MRDRNA2_25013_c0_seq1.p1 gnl/MRDRNA2_/MRDRNA2_25013_c0~~gnl/MRDRNA2_/MRDRNA2_25013_c0_seq1.p1  ORF type:complete len:128 (+),score=24.14 gnl/MRDRNA2_/MRDRNA2_25013_c0_seq1:34-384(+)
MAPPPPGSAPQLCDLNADQIPPWCWGAARGELGSCEGLESRALCRSSADDRPPHFLNPYEYATSPDEAFAALERVVISNGGEILQKQGVVAQSVAGRDAYLWAYFPKSAGVEGAWM